MTAILQDILSVFVVMAIGYLSGRRSLFSSEQAEGFNKLVLNYALPATLLASIGSSSRARLFADGPMLASTLAVLVAWYALAFLVARLAFRHTREEAGIASLSATAPTVGFLGLAILSPLYGSDATQAVAVVALGVNVVLIPVAVFLVEPAGTKPLAALASVLREPVVAAPLLAVALVLAGLDLPQSFQAPLGLIGQATSGVAVFAAGLTLAAHRFGFSWEILWNTVVKLVLVPASMLGLGLLLDPGPALEQLVLLAALPPVFTGVVLASRSRVYVETAASTLIVTMILFAAAAPIWIAVTRAVAG